MFRIKEMDVGAVREAINMRAFHCACGLVRMSRHSWPHSSDVA